MMAAGEVAKEELVSNRRCKRDGGADLAAGPPRFAGAVDGRLGGASLKDRPCCIRILIQCVTYNIKCY